MTGARVSGSLTAGLLALVAAGCASAPPEHLYALSAGALATRGPGDGLEGSAIVAPAVLPELVDRPQLVLRADSSRVEILEQQRWAEPLRAGIARVVAENLGAMLGTWRISTHDQVVGGADCRITLDVQRFDASRIGPVVSDTLWTVTCSQGARRSGRTVVAEPLPAPVTGASLDLVVGAHDRTLAALSRDVAAALQEIGPRDRRGRAEPVSR